MDIFISLSANLDHAPRQPADTISHALWLCPRERIEVLGTSALYRAPARPEGAGPDYIVTAARIQTTLDPAGIVARLRRIETAMGQGDGSLTADVLVMRLLAFGDAILPTELALRRAMGLSDDATHPLVEAATAIATATGTDARGAQAPSLPEPSLHRRADLLVPLAEIAPDWVHPVLGLTAARMAAAHPDGPSVSRDLGQVAGSPAIASLRDVAE